MHEEGILLHVRRSKTDQEGEGAQIPIPRGGRLKVVEALEAWLAAAKIADGPVFVSIGKGDRVHQKRLSDNTIGEIVKRYAAAAGFDPKMFAGHSLRAGFVARRRCAQGDGCDAASPRRDAQGLRSAGEGVPQSRW